MACKFQIPKSLTDKGAIDRLDIAL